MIRAAAASALLCLAACSQADEVVVNRMNVSDAKYNRDMDDCKKGTGLSVSLSNPVATCMQGKGYQVLMGRSRLP